MTLPSHCNGHPSRICGLIVTFSSEGWSAHLFRLTFLGTTLTEGAPPFAVFEGGLPDSQFYVHPSHAGALLK